MYIIQNAGCICIKWQNYHPGKRYRGGPIKSQFNLFVLKSLLLKFIIKLFKLTEIWKCLYRIIFANEQTFNVIIKDVIFEDRKRGVTVISRYIFSSSWSLLVLQGFRLPIRIWYTNKETKEYNFLLFLIFTSCKKAFNSFELKKPWSTQNRFRIKEA